MKPTKQRFSSENLKIHYWDISTAEDSKMRLVSSLLLQAKDGLSAIDLRELGLLLTAYLDKKSIIDNFFWDRPCINLTLNAAEIKSITNDIQKGLL